MHWNQLRCQRHFFFFFGKGATSSLGLGEEENHQRPHNWEIIHKLSGSIGDPQVNWESLALYWPKGTQWAKQGGVNKNNSSEQPIVCCVHHRSYLCEGLVGHVIEPENHSQALKLNGYFPARFQTSSGPIILFFSDVSLLEYLSYACISQGSAEKHSQ